MIILTGVLANRSERIRRDRTVLAEACNYIDSLERLRAFFKCAPDGERTVQASCAVTSTLVAGGRNLPDWVVFQDVRSLSVPGAFLHVCDRPKDAGG